MNSDETIILYENVLKNYLQFVEIICKVMDIKDKKEMHRIISLLSFESFIDEGATNLESTLLYGIISEIYETKTA